MLSRTRCLDRRIEREKVGLPGDFLDDADLSGYLGHGGNSLVHNLRTLFRRCRLLGGSSRQLTCGRAQSLASLGYVVRRLSHAGNYREKLFRHTAKRLREESYFVTAADIELGAQIARCQGPCKFHTLVDVSEDAGGP